MALESKNETVTVHAFEKASRMMPAESEVRVEYASLLTKLGKYREAFESLVQVDQAARLDPQVLYLLPSS